MLELQRRTQKQRSDTMRAVLLRSARALFMRQGFGATGTPEIAASAGVTRGALYHHFVDKTALFQAVVEAEAQAVAAAIAETEFGGLSPIETLVQGGESYLAAMRAPGRTRLLLVDAPAVLSPDRLAPITATMTEGLRAAGLAESGPMAELLSACYERAALAIDQGATAGPWRMALERLARGALR